MAEIDWNVSEMRKPFTRIVGTNPALQRRYRVYLRPAGLQGKGGGPHLPFCTASIKPLMYPIAYNRPRVV